MGRKGPSAARGGALGSLQPGVLTHSGAGAVSMQGPNSCAEKGRACCCVAGGWQPGAQKWPALATTGNAPPALAAPSPSALLALHLC